MPKKCDAYDNTCAGYEGHEGNHGTAWAFQLRGLPYFEEGVVRAEADKEGSESGEQQPGGEKAPDASHAPLASLPSDSASSTAGAPVSTPPFAPDSDGRVYCGWHGYRHEPPVCVSQPAEEQP